MLKLVKGNFLKTSPRLLKPTLLYRQIGFDVKPPEIQDYFKEHPRGLSRKPLNFCEGDEFHNFKCIQVVPVPEYNITAYKFVHHPTRADYIHIDTHDTDNAFSITFRTPSLNDTGHSHILEHTTLCGSERYPVHDPFMKMLKRSQQTFMNAMTFDDHTSYPFSTTLPVDFVHLMDVYCDATFFPLLRVSDFMQEGWRFEDGMIKGVVYNEMKGRMSSQYMQLANIINQQLFSGTSYSFESGGLPSAIPSLKYSDLVQFHHSHYHPSNAMFYSYGDLSPALHMNYLNNRILSRFSLNEKSHQIKVELPSVNFSSNVFPGIEETGDGRNVQCRIPISREVCAPCGVPNDTTKMYFELFPSHDTCESEDTMGLLILSQLLFSGIGSPMFQSLISSGLASTFSPMTGFNTYARRSFMCIGLGGVSESLDENVLHSAVYQTLVNCAQSGFEQRHIDALFNQIQLDFKQVRTNMGLHMMYGVSEGWTHGVDLCSSLQRERLLNQLRSQGVNDVMKKLIKKYLLSPHCIRTHLLDHAHANPSLSNDTTEKSTSCIHRLVIEQDPEYYAKLSEREAILTESVRVSELYNGEPSRESLLQVNSNSFVCDADDSVLPSLSVDDIPRVHKVLSPIPMSNNPSITHISTPTNGVVHVRISLDLSHLTDESDLRHLPFALMLLNKVGDKHISTTDLEILEKMCCSGVEMGVSPFEKCISDGNHFKNVLHISSSLVCDSEHMKSFEELLVRKLSNRNLFLPSNPCQQLLMSSIQSLKSEYPDRVHVYNRSRLLSHYSIPHKLSDIYGGSTAFEVAMSMEQLTEDNSRLESFLENDLVSLLNRSLSPNDISIHVVSDDCSKSTVLDFANCLQASIQSALSNSYDPSVVVGNPVNRLFDSHIVNGFIHASPLQSKANCVEDPRNEFTIVPSDTNYVCMTYPTVTTSHPSYHSIVLLNQILSQNFLLKHIREEGGAYGTGGAVYNGVHLISSYSDPNVSRSVEYFEKGIQWLKDGKFSARDVEEAKLILFSSIDSPIPPLTMGLPDIYTGMNSMIRQQNREKLLSLKVDELIKDANEFLKPSSENIRISVMGTETTSNEFIKKPNWTVAKVAFS